MEDLHLAVLVSTNESGERLLQVAPTSTSPWGRHKSNRLYPCRIMFGRPRYMNIMAQLGPDCASDYKRLQTELHRKLQNKLKTNKAYNVYP